MRGPWTGTPGSECLSERSYFHESFGISNMSESETGGATSGSSTPGTGCSESEIQVRLRIAMQSKQSKEEGSDQEEYIRCNDLRKRFRESRFAGEDVVKRWDRMED